MLVGLDSHERLEVIVNACLMRYSIAKQLPVNNNRRTIDAQDFWRGRCM